LPEQGRDWLSGTLRRLREDAGLSGNQAAKLTGISQSEISRIEAGRTLPRDDTIRKLCKLYRVPASLRTELLQAAADIRPETVQARVVLSRQGGAKLQERFSRIEAASAEVRSYEPALIPGSLQTAGYMRALFSSGLTGDDLEQAVEARMKRAAMLTSGRAYAYVVAEGALRWQLGSPEIMLGQLGHLAEVIGSRPNVRFGVIPQSQAVTFVTTHGFTLYDQRMAIAATRTGTTFITDPKDVADYSKLFGDLEAVAAFGDDAVAVIRQVAEGYRAG
jgi:transcriptional regulator with XRE-family HTH domain